MNVYDNLNRLGLKIPKPPAKGGIYSQVRKFGGLAFCSGCGPDLNGEPFKRGKVGVEVSPKEARDAARNCLLNLLAVIGKELGDLNKVKSFSKMLALVASGPDFYDQPKIIDAASELLAEIYGQEAGMPARSAIGTNALPGNIPVEIELMFELNV